MADACGLWGQARRLGDYDAFQFPGFRECDREGGSTPVFADIDPATFNIDPQQVAPRLKEAKARALLPVHLYGQCADVDALQQARMNSTPYWLRMRLKPSAPLGEGASWRFRVGGGVQFLSHQESERLRRRRNWLQPWIPTEPTTCAGFAAMEVRSAMFTKNWAGTRTCCHDDILREKLTHRRVE